MVTAGSYWAQLYIGNVVSNSFIWSPYSSSLIYHFQHPHFSRGRNWGISRWNNSSDLMQLTNARAGIQIWEIWPQIWTFVTSELSASFVTLIPLSFSYLLILRIISLKYWECYFHMKGTLMNRKPPCLPGTCNLGKGWSESSSKWWGQHKPRPEREKEHSSSQNCLHGWSAEDPPTERKLSLEAGEAMQSADQTASFGLVGDLSCNVTGRVMGATEWF